MDCGRGRGLYSSRSVAKRQWGSCVSYRVLLPPQATISALLNPRSRSTSFNSSKNVLTPLS